MHKHTRTHPPTKKHSHTLNTDSQKNALMYTQIHTQTMLTHSNTQRNTLKHINTHANTRTYTHITNIHIH